MMRTPKQPDQSFWKEEPDFQPFSRQSLGAFMSLFKIYKILFALVIFGLCFAVFYSMSPILAWFWLVFLLIGFGRGFYLRKQKNLELQEIVKIQQRTTERTGASLIGSAVHVAGHPLLEREQNVVLALKHPYLSVYSYATDQPLALIPLEQIISLQTVVYDDERIPHVDVVDSTAQAIQLMLRYGDQEIACLFRRMKKVRPIDWYHAIQKSRIG